MIKCWRENSSKAYCIRLWIRPEGLGPEISWRRDVYSVMYVEKEEKAGQMQVGFYS